MCDLLVIGLDVQFADQASIDRFDRCVYLGDAVTQPKLTQRSSFSEHCLQSLQQLQAANAVKPEDMHVLLIAMNPHSLTIDVLKNSHYRSFSVVATFAQAINKALLLSKEGMPVAMVAAHLLDESINEHSVVAHTKASISFDGQFEGYHQVEGVASVLLANAVFAKAHQAYVYAHIKGFSSFADVATACAQALNDSSYTVSDIKYLEVSALADANDAQAEMLGIIKGYNTDKTLNTAVGSLRAITGEAFEFSQLTGFIKTVIVTYQRYFPCIKDWHAPANNLWNESPFYFPIESRPWFPNANGKPLVSAYSCLSSLDYCHIILQENALMEERTNGFMACSELILLPIKGNNQAQLLSGLNNVLADYKDFLSLSDCAAYYYEKSLKADSLYTLTIIAESKEELVKEIELAKDGISTAFATGHEWKTPKGSFFTPEPVGHNKNVAFMYPGIGATYIGLARDIFHLFPEIYMSVARLADDIASSLKDTILYPRTIARPSFAEVKQMDHDLRAHLPNIAECGVGFACVFTKIFETVFQLRADFSAGYSMGEISMYAALGCWKKPGEMSERLAKSETFNHRLTGRLDTLRHHWGLPDAQPGDTEKLWETYTIKSTPEAVAEACEDEDRVYCTIINTPDSLVIGGYPEACERVIKKLGVRGMALDIQNAIHSEPAFKEYESMEALYTMEVDTRLETKIYSSSCYLPIPQRSKSIANSIAKCLCDPVDFPRLVNTVYDKGSRVFIEMGPGRSLCSWVDKILKHSDIKPHVAVPVNAKGVSDELTIIRAVAKLLSHGVQMNMHSIYYGSLINTIHSKAQLSAVAN